MHHYIFSSLRVASEFQFTLAPMMLFEGVADVTIVFDDSLQKPQNPAHNTDNLCANPNDLWFAAHDDLAFRMQNGNQISIYRGNNVSDADVNLYLMGTGLGVIFLQRNLIPFHCSAVVHQGRAIAFTGESGAGKSTLAAALTQHGFAHVCDDVCVADPSILPLQVTPMPKGLKLWDEAAAQLNIDRGARVSTIPHLDKSYVDVRNVETQTSLQFDTLYVLRTVHDEEPEITEVRGALKHAEIARAIYRGEWLEYIHPRQKTFEMVTELSHHIRVFEFLRPNNLARIHDGAKVLIDHFTAQQSQ